MPLGLQLKSDEVAVWKESNNCPNSFIHPDVIQENLFNFQWFCLGHLNRYKCIIGTSLQRLRQRKKGWFWVIYSLIERAASLRHQQGCVDDVGIFYVMASVVEAQ